MTAPTPSGEDSPDWDNALICRHGADACPVCFVFKGELEKARAALLAARRGEHALRDAAKDCADDLESEIRARYGHPDIHPAMRQKYERDMEPVSLVRAALAATPERDTAAATQEEK